jgi:hypothetical protein
MMARHPSVSFLLPFFSVTSAVRFLLLLPLLALLLQPARAGDSEPTDRGAASVLDAIGNVNYLRVLGRLIHLGEAPWINPLQDKLRRC